MKRVRIDLVAPPMSGHLHPMLGIARRLARDHDVRVFSTAAARPEIVAAGLEPRVLLAGADAQIETIVNPPYAVRGIPWRLHAQFKANLNLLELLYAELLENWRGAAPDLVLADFTVPAAGSAALELGVHWWTVTPSALAMESPDGPPGYLGGWRPGVGVIGRTRDAVGRSLVRGFKQGVHALYRDRLRQIGFPSLYRVDGSEAVYSDERVLAVSLEELEFPRTYPASVEFVGPVLYSPPADAPEPPFTVGRPHVLVTLGTHLGWHRAEVAAAVQRAARRLPHVEFHLSDGDRNSARRESLGNVHRIGFISYTQHVAKYAVVVHHGGAGVLAHTLAAGTPAVVVPVDFDQFDYAARLAAAGVAIRVKRLRDLPGAVAKALDDETIRAACLRMSAKLSAGAAEERIAERVARYFA